MIEAMEKPTFVCDAHSYNEDTDRIPFQLNHFGTPDPKRKRYIGKHLHDNGLTGHAPNLSNTWRRSTDIPGVYVFRDSDECLYVGSSKISMKIRILHHLRRESGTPLAGRLEAQDFNEILVEFYPCKPADVLIEEMRATIQWRPTCNKAVPGKLWRRRP